jgi:hypothetical protein
VKLQKDTVLSLVKGATVFINYLGACFESFDSIQGLCPSIPRYRFADRPIARSCHVCLPPLSHFIIMLRTHILRGLSDATFTRACHIARTRSRLRNNTKVSLRRTCSKPWSSSSLPTLSRRSRPNYKVRLRPNAFTRRTRFTPPIPTDILVVFSLP